MFALGGRFDMLSGVVYANDALKTEGLFFISSVDAHGAKASLFNVALGPGKQAAFKISIHGVTSLVLGTGGAGFFDIVAGLTPAGQAPAVSPGPQVVVRYPTGGAGVAAGSKVPFAWEAFPDAVSYVLQIWLVKQAGTTAITARTPVVLSTLVFQKTTYVWDDRGFLPGDYQYDLIPLDAEGNALAPRSSPQQITVAS
jgi:hypothetical protein